MLFQRSANSSKRRQYFIEDCKRLHSDDEYKRNITARASGLENSKRLRGLPWELSAH